MVFLRKMGDGGAALALAVALPEDVTEGRHPPLDDLQRHGRTAVPDELEAADIVLLDVRYGEDGDEVGRHDGYVGGLFVLDELERAGGIEELDDDVAGAHIEQRADHGVPGDVEHRRDLDVPVVRLDALVDNIRPAVVPGLAVGVKRPARDAGGAAGVNDEEPVVFFHADVRLFGRIGFQQVFDEQHVRGALFQGDKVADATQTRPHRPGDARHLQPDKKGVDLRVVDEVVEFVGAETRVEPGEDIAAFHGRPVDDGVVQAVPGQYADGVALADAELLEGVYQAVDPGIEAGVGQALVAVDIGHFVRAEQSMPVQDIGEGTDVIA